MSISDTPISFEGYKIEDLSYSHVKEAPDCNLKFDGGIGIPDDSDEGVVRQKIVILNEKNNALIQIMLLGMFKRRTQLSKEDFERFLGTNGAAMLYPYVRSICSLLSSLDGPDNVILPALNFKDAYDDYLEKLKKSDE